MNAVGIDVSKGKSMVAVMQPLGVVAASPFEVAHTESELRELAKFLKRLPGETKVVMEYTGSYYEPIARFIHNEGIYVSVVNAILIHNYSGNSVRRAKTDKKDSVRIAQYALDRWLDLREYVPVEETRSTLTLLNRQYSAICKHKTQLINNLISLIDQSFPNANEFFDSPARQSDGHMKWVDFIIKFPHRNCVSGISRAAFKDKYSRWCKKQNYNYAEEKADEIYDKARSCVATLPDSKCVQTMIQQSAKLLNSTLETAEALRKSMTETAEQLPEYSTVIGMYGVGRVLAPQLMAEIGDTRRSVFRKADNAHSRKAITAFAGLDAPPYQSGTVDVKSRSISKRGSPHLRRTLFLVVETYLKRKPVDEPVYQFLDRKRSEGKLYKVYMTAAANKFLRIYYARVNEVLNA